MPCRLEASGASAAGRAATSEWRRAVHGRCRTYGLEKLCRQLLMLDTPDVSWPLESFVARAEPLITRPDAVTALTTEIIDVWIRAAGWPIGVAEKSAMPSQQLSRLGHRSGVRAGPATPACPRRTHSATRGECASYARSSASRPRRPGASLASLTSVTQVDQGAGAIGGPIPAQGFISSLGGKGPPHLRVGESVLATVDHPSLRRPF